MVPCCFSSVLLRPPRLQPHPGPSWSTLEHNKFKTSLKGTIFSFSECQVEIQGAQQVKPLLLSLRQGFYLEVWKFFLFVLFYPMPVELNDQQSFLWGEVQSLSFSLSLYTNKDNIINLKTCYGCNIPMIQSNHISFHIAQCFSSFSKELQIQHPGNHLGLINSFISMFWFKNSMPSAHTYKSWAIAHALKDQYSFTCKL